MPVHEAIDWCKHGEADLRHPRRREPQQDQQRRQENDTETKRNDHADAGNGAELRHADIAGWQEGEEACTDRGCRQRQRSADARPRLDERRLARGMDESLSERTDAQLNAEIDTEAHEERNEGHRNEVETANHQQSASCRQDEACQSRNDDRKNDARRADGKPQDPQQRRKHRPEHDMNILGKRREFLVRQRNRACQPNANTVRRIKTERPGDMTNRIACRGSRLQRRIVHHRLNQQDMTRLAAGCLPVDEERPPGKESRPARHGVLERFREGRQCRFDVLQRSFAVLDAHQHLGKYSQDAAQALIGPQSHQQGSSLHEATRRRPGIFHRQEQQALALEEGASGGPTHGPEKIPPLLQGSNQPVGRVIRQFGSGAIDHNDGQVNQLRKGRIEGELSLPPVQSLRNQLPSIGGHCKILCCEDQRRECETGDEQQHDPGMPHAGRDRPADQRSPSRHDASQRWVRRRQSASGLRTKKAHLAGRFCLLPNIVRQNWLRVLTTSLYRTRSTRFAMVVLRFRPVIIQLAEPSPANPDRLAGLKGKCPGIIGHARRLD